MQQVHPAKIDRGYEIMEIGLLCLKIAGRDANSKCVVLKNIDNTLVLIDGETRRKNCNVKHIEPFAPLQKLALKENASHAEVVKEFAKLGITLTEKKSKTDGTHKPKRLRKTETKEEPVKKKK